MSAGWRAAPAGPASEPELPTPSAPTAVFVAASDGQEAAGVADDAAGAASGEAGSAAPAGIQQNLLRKIVTSVLRRNFPKEAQA